MSESEYDDFVEYSRQHFEEGLIRAGFHAAGTDEWRGTIRRPSENLEVRVTMSSGFPFQPPRVFPIAPNVVPWSWHRELDGALCLVAEDDHEDVWWMDPTEFLRHAEAWLSEADDGWPNDRTDLDLGRYFEASDDLRLYLYDDLTPRNGSFARFRGNRTVMKIQPRVASPRPSSRRSTDRIAYIADLGEVTTPPRSWSDIAARLDASARVEELIRNGAVTAVFLTYQRGSHQGTIALDIGVLPNGQIQALRLPHSAADTDAARMVRAGILAPQLRDSRVAVVGVGAVGSFVADYLARAGVGHLTLIDDDLVMPGNVIRHLVGPEAVGLSKVEAVKRHLTQRATLRDEDIDAIQKSLDPADAVLDVLSRHDLVVNATADFATTAMLRIAAESIGRHILSVAVQNDGATVRVDILPPMNHAPELPSSSNATLTTVDVFESGCGSPISPTPPPVVAEAAAVAARHAIGLLTHAPIDPAGEVRELTPRSEGSMR